MKMLRIALLALSIQSAQAQQAPARIQGIVMEQGRPEPVWGATVELRQEGNPTPVYGIVTGQDGKFSFPSVQPGRYQLISASPGFVVAEYGQRRMKGPGLPLTIAPGQQINDIRIMMTPTGAISGRVIDPTGQPMVLADVFALKSSYQEGQRILTQSLSAKTDERGEFRIFWLTPGPYYLNVIVPDGTSQFSLIINADGADTASTLVLNRNSLRDVLSRPIGTGAAENEAHVPIYFPGTPNAQEARVIDVRPGADIRGLNLIAGVVKTVRIRGVITNGVTGELPGTSPTQTRLISLDPAVPGINGQIDARTGKFEFVRVSPGSYVLYVQMRPTANSTPAEVMWGSMPVEVRDRDIEDIAISARPGVSITGKVVLEGQPDTQGASPAAGLFLGMRPDPLITQQSPSPSTRVSPDGTFTLPGVIAGKYRAYVIPLLTPLNPSLTSGLPPLPPALQGLNAYVKAVRVGGVDTLENGVRLAATENMNMEIVLGFNAGTLEGRVTHTVEGKQEPAADMTVGVVPNAIAARGFRTDMHKATLTDSSGRFQLRGLPPGDYKVFAWEEADRDAILDLDFIKTHEERGIRVRLEEGDKQSVELTAIPARTQ